MTSEGNLLDNVFRGIRVQGDYSCLTHLDYNGFQLIPICLVSVSVHQKKKVDLNLEEDNVNEPAEAFTNRPSLLIELCSYLMCALKWSSVLVICLIVILMMISSLMELCSYGM